MIDEKEKNSEKGDNSNIKKALSEEVKENDTKPTTEKEQKPEPMQAGPEQAEPKPAAPTPKPAAKPPATASGIDVTANMDPEQKERFNALKKRQELSPKAGGPERDFIKRMRNVKKRRAIRRERRRQEMLEKIKSKG